MNVTEGGLLQSGYIQFYSDSVFDGRYGLPNTLRESMLQAYAGQTARVLDALLACGMQLGSAGYTFKQLFAYLQPLGVRANTARAALVAFRTAAKVRTKGRSAYTYALPTLATLASMYRVDVTKPEALINDPLRAADMATLANYRLALYREHLSRYTLKNGGQIQMPRELLSDRLGLTRTATRHYDAILGTVARQIYVTVDRCCNKYDVPLITAKFGHSRRYFARCIDYGTGRGYNAPLAPVALYRALKQGFEIEIIQQSYNAYSLPPTGGYCPTEDSWGYSIWRSTADEIAHSALAS